MAKRPTEEELGIAPTAEELAPPPQVEQEDEFPREEDPTGADQHIIAGKAPETDAEAVAAGKVRDPATGQFVAKTEVSAAPTDRVRPPPGFVDQRALSEARMENKRLAERFETLMEIVNRRPQPAQPEVAPPEIPDPDTDPVGAVKWARQQIIASQEQAAAQTQARQQADAEQSQTDQVMAFAGRQFQEAAAADPTLPQIEQALMESYGRELLFINRNNPEFQRDQRGFMQRELQKLEIGHIRFAVSSGVHIADYMRDLAASRGISIGPAQAQRPDSAAGQPVAARTIQERQQAQQRHQSLGDLPGAAVEGKIDAKSLAKMSDKEFRALAKRLGDDGMDALMGKE